MTSILAPLFAPTITPEWLHSQYKTVHELLEEVTDAEKLRALTQNCNALSEKYIKYPQEVADEAWQKNQDAFISRIRWTFPFDHARTCRDIDGFFINASDMVLEGQKYIASQSPLSTTLADFWKMIIHTKATTIVALNMPQDDQGDPHPRPVEYWKQNGSQESLVFDNWKVFDSEDAKIQTLISFDDWTVQFTKREVVAKEDGTDFAIVRREFIVFNSQTAEERTIKQFHFQHWPDFQGAPTDRLFTKLLEHVEAEHTTVDSPLVVHCAAGKGRTGSFIAAHSIRRHIRQEQVKGSDEIKVNLPRTIYTMRQHRKDMVNDKGVLCICKVLNIV